MIKVKTGVDVRGLHLKMWEAVYLILPIFKRHKTALVITSALDGEHSHGSLHYVGLAIDIRKRDLDFATDVFYEILKALPDGYDVVNESTHFHIEWQPKDRSEL